MNGAVLFFQLYNAVSLNVSSTELSQCLLTTRHKYYIGWQIDVSVVMFAGAGLTC